ncbi:hypothetical protein BJX99DRAFT_251466 [Aspergillus californicus]
MLQELDQEVNSKKELTREPAAWRHVYAIMHCPGSCGLGPHCWQDPYGKKHYKLYRDEILSLVSYVKSGKRLESHKDVPGMIREQIYRAERRRLEGQKANASRLNLTGLRDANVKAYCAWQQLQKACDVALDNGFDLDLIDKLSDPDYFEKRGVVWGIAYQFIKDIRYWAETRNQLVRQNPALLSQPDSST